MLTMITGSSEPIKWTKHRNTIMAGGRPDSSSTVASCKTQCVDSPDCTGIVWNKGSCFLHGPSWSNGQMVDLGGDHGIDYYELTRNDAQALKCAGKCHASLDLICTVDAKIFTNYQKKLKWLHSSGTAHINQIIYKETTNSLFHVE